MLQAFLILLAGGVQLAMALPSPASVAPNWLRLGGLLSIVLTLIAVVIALSGHELSILLFATIALLVMQSLLLRSTVTTLSRFLGFLCLIVCILAARTTQSLSLPPAGALGVAAVCGLALMDMLLGHAYLTASGMTIAPFRLLNRCLAGAIGLRAVESIGITLLMNSLHPVEMLWPEYGLLIGIRWLMGLALPGLLVYMADDCIRRRATQSATGILYTLCTLVFIGEILALHLAVATGLPW